MHSTRTAGVSSIIAILIGAAAIGVGALMSSNQSQTPYKIVVSTDPADASSSVAIAVEEEGVKRTVRSEAEISSQEALDADDDDDTAPEAESSSPARVAYTADGFSPQTISISVGTTVRFENVSGPEMWVTSETHSAQEAHDGTAQAEHCPDLEGDNLDQCEVGQTYSYTFEAAGEFGYHNNQNPEHTGVIIVTEE